MFNVKNGLKFDIEQSVKVIKQGFNKYEFEFLKIEVQFILKVKGLLYQHLFPISISHIL